MTKRVGTRRRACSNSVYDVAYTSLLAASQLLNKFDSKQCRRVCFCVLCEHTEITDIRSVSIYNIADAMYRQTDIQLTGTSAERNARRECLDVGRIPLFSHVVHDERRVDGIHSYLHNHTKRMTGLHSVTRFTDHAMQTGAPRDETIQW